MLDQLASSLGDSSQYHILREPAHTTLAQSSLVFLLYLDDHIKDPPLAEYAAEHWVTHVSNSRTTHYT